jgi:hypothetical protein
VTARGNTCNAHQKHSPFTGKCGRREREVEPSYGAEQSVRRTRIATVEGILVFGMAIPFAGYGRSAGLGRSDASLGFLPSGSRAGDSGCPEEAKEGNVVSTRFHACATAAPASLVADPGDTSFTRSSGPCTQFVTILMRRKPYEVTRSE